MSWAVLEKIGLHFIQRLVTQGNVKIGKFLNMVQSRPLFVYFRPFHITIQIEKTERRCCAHSGFKPQVYDCTYIQIVDTLYSRYYIFPFMKSPSDDDMHTWRKDT